MLKKILKNITNTFIKATEQEHKIENKIQDFYEKKEKKIELFQRILMTTIGIMLIYISLINTNIILNSEMLQDYM